MLSGDDFTEVIKRAPGIFALLLATMQPPLRVSQILAELSEGAPLQTWTWIGSPASLDQKKTR